jgi:hypothetical protein
MTQSGRALAATSLFFAEHGTQKEGAREANGKNKSGDQKENCE